MNWGELKTEIMNLGFEENSTMNEYASIVIDSANRAINTLIQDVIVPNKDYFGALYGTKKTIVDDITGEVTTKIIKWQQPEVEPITSDTPDSFEIDLPDRVLPILSRLAAHWIWLDDDQVKATIYWNEYDEFRQRLEEEARSRNYNCEFYGGLWF